MTSRLVENWKSIVARAWSVRFAIAAGLLSSAELILPLFVNSVPRGLFAALSVMATTGAVVARVLVQKNL